jgi:hypothetical protein
MYFFTPWSSARKMFQTTNITLHLTTKLNVTVISRLKLHHSVLSATRFSRYESSVAPWKQSHLTYMMAVPCREPASRSCVQLYQWTHCKIDFKTHNAIATKLKLLETVEFKPRPLLITLLKICSTIVVINSKNTICRQMLLSKMFLTVLLRLSCTG